MTVLQPGAGSSGEGIVRDPVARRRPRGHQPGTPRQHADDGGEARHSHRHPERRDERGSEEIPVVVRCPRGSQGVVTGEVRRQPREVQRRRAMGAAGSRDVRAGQGRRRPGGAGGPGLHSSDGAGGDRGRDTENRGRLTGLSAAGQRCRPPRACAGHSRWIVARHFSPTGSRETRLVGESPAGGRDGPAPSGLYRPPSSG